MHGKDSAPCLAQETGSVMVTGGATPGAAADSLAFYAHRQNILYNTYVYRDS